MFTNWGTISKVSAITVTVGVTVGLGILTGDELLGSLRTGSVNPVGRGGGTGSLGSSGPAPGGIDPVPIPPGAAGSATGPRIELMGGGTIDSYAKWTWSGGVSNGYGHNLRKALRSPVVFSVCVGITGAIALGLWAYETEETARQDIKQGPSA